MAKKPPAWMQTDRSRCNQYGCSQPPEAPALVMYDTAEKRLARALYCREHREAMMRLGFEPEE